MSDHLRASQIQPNFANWPTERRRTLATLIEKGLDSKLPQTLAEHPDVSQPFVFGFESCILSAEANTIGFALMGLDIPFMEIWVKFMEEVKKDHGDYQNTGLAVAAEMLNMPYQLLWDAEFLRFFGFCVESVIEALRA